MTKKQGLAMAVIVLLIGVLTSVGSFAFWSWSSNTPKNIVFNTSDDLSEYIIYDEGDSTFTGDLQVSDNFQYGIQSTIAIQKTQEVTLICLLPSTWISIKSGQT